MPRAKKEKSDSPERDSVTLRIKAGPQTGYTRTFTRAEHGEDFEKHAAKWKEHFGAEEVL